MSALQKHFVADDAGALLVRSGLVTASALEDARARQASAGGTIGEQLVFIRALSDEALTEFYRSRLLVPQVNPNLLAKLAANVVQTIPADMAIELRVIPIQLDNDTNLTVAMGDPSDSHAVDELGFFTGTYVVRAIATQMQIAWCLAHYYGHVTELGQRLLTPQPGQKVTPVSPRPKGLTSRVEAARHRALAPVTGPVDVPRPNAQLLEPGVSAGVPEPAPPRARTASGEIRVPLPRAASIKPVIAIDEEASGPTITIEVSDDVTGPSVIVAPPQRTRKAKTDPPELAARGGEITSAPRTVRQVDVEEPRVVISMDDDDRAPTDEPGDDDDTGSVTIHAGTPQDIELIESAPILLDRKRPSDPPPNAVPQAPDEEVVELSTPKSQRLPRLTQIGIGALPAVTRMHRDTDAVPSMIEDGPTTSDVLAGDETRVDMLAAPAREDSSGDTTAAPPGPARDDDTNPNLIAAPPPPVARAGTLGANQEPDDEPDDERDDERDDEPDDGDRDVGNATSVMSAVQLDASIPDRQSQPALERKTEPFGVVGRKIDRTDTPVAPPPRAKRIEHDDVDDGWGPPGTTIPPPLLGAIPGTDEDAPSGVIPLPSEDSTPLMMMTAPANAPEFDLTGQTLVRALEDSTARAIELIRTLETALTRDDVIAMMIGHLAQTHRRAGFLSMKSNELTVFAMTPRPLLMPQAALRLDRPSTFQDVVGTRLPYRGPIADEASRMFLSSAFDGAAPTEILLVPVAVRERVVGVLFADQRSRHTFDDQLGLAARAAGMALERILKTRRN